MKRVPLAMRQHEPITDAAECIQFTTAAEKATVPDTDTDGLGVTSGNFEVDVVFEIAIFADADAVRPGDA